MKRICSKCETEQKRAYIQGLQGKFSLSLNRNKFFINTMTSSEITPYVCPKCGYIEFYVDAPEKL